MRLGIARTFQKIRLFRHLSVLDNVVAGFHTHHDIPAWQYLIHGAAFQRDHRRCRAQAMELLSFVGLAARRDALAGSLSYGEQRLLEFARALGQLTDALVQHRGSLAFSTHGRQKHLHAAAGLRQSQNRDLLNPV